MPARRFASRQELAVFEERGVAPVVRDQPCEAHAEARVVIARVVMMAGVGADVGVFPFAPRERRAVHASSHRTTRAARRTRRRDRRHDRLRVPRLGSVTTPPGKMRPIARVTHSTSAWVVFVTLTRIISVMRSGWASRVREPEGASPRSAPGQPAVDAEMRSDALTVGNQLCGRVGRGSTSGSLAFGVLRPQLR